MADSCWVYGHPHAPISCLRGDRGELICSVNGHAFAVTAHPYIVELVARLGTGRWRRVGSLVQRHTGKIFVDGNVFDAGPEDVRAVLEKLCSLRALIVSS